MEILSKTSIEIKTNISTINKSDSIGKPGGGGAAAGEGGPPPGPAKHVPAKDIKIKKIKTLHLI